VLAAIPQPGLQQAAVAAFGLSWCASYWMQTMPGFVQMFISGLQQTNPGPHCTSPHLSTLTQMPPQSAPPAFGSQVSLGSSTQL
jgi:hypothetical protein